MKPAWWPALCIICGLLWQACYSTTPPKPLSYTPKSTTPPSILYCFDSVGHIAGSKPYLLGGTCVCTPSAAILKDYQLHGYFVGENLEMLENRYRQLGIQTAHQHQHCNNACPWGPHVVKGGHCMVPPTPGTKNYEEILSGRFHKEIHEPIKTTP